MHRIILQFFQRVGVLIFLAFLGALLGVTAEAAPRQSARVIESAGERGPLSQLAARKPDVAATLRSLDAEARAKGNVRVTVKLAVAFAPGQSLRPDERVLQDQELKAALAALKAALPQARSFAQRAGLPYVDIDVDQAGLARLQTVPGVSRISRPDAVDWRRDFVEIRGVTGSKLLASGKVRTQGVPADNLGITDVEADVQPYRVALFIALPDYDNSDPYFCGGSLIAARFVLTTASCSSFVGSVDYVTVVVGRRLDGSARIFKVKKISVHPQFVVGDFDSAYDVAVWELATPVTGVPFARLATSPPPDVGDTLQMTGWGHSDYTSPLGKTDVRVAPSINGSCGGTGDLVATGSLTICTMTPPALERWRGTVFGAPLTRGRGDSEEIVALYSDVEVHEDFSHGDYAAFVNVADSRNSSFIRSVLSAGDRTIGFDLGVYLVDVTNVQSDQGGPPLGYTSSWRDNLVKLGGLRAFYVWVIRDSSEGSAWVSYRTVAGSARPLTMSVQRAMAAGTLYSGDYKYIPASGIVRFAPGQTAAWIATILIQGRAEDWSYYELGIQLTNPSPGWTLRGGNTRLFITPAAFATSPD